MPICEDDVEYFPEGLQGCDDVRFWDCGVGLQITDEEKPLYDSVAVESTLAEGEPVEFYSQDLDRTVRDPVTRQVRKRAWKGPWVVKSRIEWPDSTPEVREEGFVTNWSSRIWMPRALLEQLGAPVPQEGDVVRFWDIPFFNDKIRLKQLFPAGLFFNVVDVDSDGHIGSTSTFVGFWLTIKRRTDYPPERRVFDER